MMLHPHPSLNKAVLKELQDLPGILIHMYVRIHKQKLGSCPESLVARGQARLFGVAGSNPPGSVSTSLSESSVSVSLIHACGGITPCV